MEKELDMEDFIRDMVRDTPQKQQAEVKTWERVFESCKEFVDKYETELNAKDKPFLERLFVMQETINTYIQLFTKRKQPYQFDYNMIQLPHSGNSVERYTKWKSELLDINLSNCNTILKRIDTRIIRLQSTPAPSTLPPASDEPKLTERETVLIHCYQNKPAILHGQPGYADYLKYGRPTDRVRYPNESVRKAKALIKSIHNVMPFLTDAQIEQAESEINTINANFPDQL